MLARPFQSGLEGASRSGLSLLAFTHQDILIIWLIGHCIIFDKRRQPKLKKFLNGRKHNFLALAPWVTQKNRFNPDSSCAAQRFKAITNDVTGILANVKISANEPNNAPSSIELMKQTCFDAVALRSD